MYSNICLLYGEEDFFIEQELKLRIKTFKEQYPGIEIKKYSEDADLDEIFNDLFTQIMFTSSRLIIINDFYLLEETSKDDPGVAKCLKALQGIPENVFIIFSYKGSPPVRNKIFDLIKKQAEAVEFKSFTEWHRDELLRWVIRQFKDLGKSVNIKVAELLVEIVGRDLSFLHSEIKKLSVYVGSKKEVDRQDIEAIVSFGGIDTFLYLEALKHKNASGAVSALERLLSFGEIPQRLIAFLLTYYRTALQVKFLMQKGYGLSEIASRLKANPFFVKKSSEGLNRVTLDKLEKNMFFLLDADVAIKSGTPARVALELLTTKLCE